MDWINIATALLSALITGGAVAIYLAKSQKKINEAKAKSEDAGGDKLAAESWAILVTNLVGRVAVLEEQNAAKDGRIDELECEIGDLRKYMEDHGLQPPPRKPRSNKPAP